MPSQVFLVFKTHLDVGFTDFAANVVEAYFSRFIPAALETARELRQAGEDRLVWTTGSWLIYEYLERAAPAERKRMEEAILAGDITWHGLPFTLHSELLDPGLFRCGLSLAQALDRRFGKRTLAAKMTDVPGHTRGIVPLLAEAGIRFLHIGVNPASTPPRVPSLFVWSDPSGADLIVMVQKGSYGERVPVPGRPSVLSFAHSSDNLGPPAAQEVRQIYRAERDRDPGAQVFASTLDAFAAELETVKATLPVISGELGDSWVHGAGSDPQKISRFRELLRLRRTWLASGAVCEAEPHFAAFSRRLLLVPEHTWGLDVKTHLADSVNFAAGPFHAARSRANFRKMEASWAEQRGYLDGAIQALGPSPLAREAAARLEALQPIRFGTEGMEALSDPSRLFETEHFLVGFDPQTGAITRLRNRSTGREWANRLHPLGEFRYETFSAQDMERFFDQYILKPARRFDWARQDFTKPGMEACAQAHQEWLPILSGLFSQQDQQGQRFVLNLRMPEIATHAYGAPAEVCLQVTCFNSAPEIALELQWFEKAACRFPEALWLSFCPSGVRARGWTMEKLGEWISPQEVVPDGNRKLHAVGRGIRYDGGRDQLAIETLDAPLVAPGARSLLDFNNRLPPLRRGMHFNLFNNVWGTNFPMWSDEDARFRFLIQIG